MSSERPDDKSEQMIDDLDKRLRKGDARLIRLRKAIAKLKDQFGRRHGSS